MAGETVAPPSSGATRTPSSGSKAKGYSDLKSRLQKLQESPSFAVPAASTPASAHSTGEWAVHSARAPHSAAAVATPPSVSSAGQHPAAEWTVLSARDAGSSGLLRLAPRAAPRALRRDPDARATRVQGDRRCPIRAPLRRR